MTPVETWLPDEALPPGVTLPPGYKLLGYNPDGTLRVADPNGQIASLPAPTVKRPADAATGVTVNQLAPGGNQYKPGVPPPQALPGDQVRTQPVDRAAPQSAPLPPSRDPAAAPQGITVGQQFIPAFRTSDLSAPAQWTEADIQRATQQLSGLSEQPVSREQALAFLGRQSASLQNVGNYFQNWDTLNQDNWRFFAGDNPDEMTLWMKDAPKERSNVTLRRQGDYWVPQGDSVTREQWDTNANNRMRNQAFAMMAAGGLAGSYFPGSETAAVGTVESAAGASPWVATGETGLNVLGTEVAAGYGAGGGSTAALSAAEVAAIEGAGGLVGAGGAGGAANLTAAQIAALQSAPGWAEAVKQGAGAVGQFVKDNKSWLAPLVTGAISSATAPKPPEGGGAGGAGGASGIEQQYLDLAKEQWLWSKGMDEKFAPLYEKLIRDSMADADKQRARGDTMWSEYQTTYMPMQRRQAEDANNYDNPAEVAKREGIAAATVARGFDQQRGQLDRALAANGVSASSGRALGASTEMANAQALGTAAARNTTRDEARLTGMALRDNAIRTGMAVGGAGLSRDLAATGSGGAATGTMGSQVNTRNASLAPVFSGLSGGLAANNTAFNQLQQNYQNRTARHNNWAKLGGAAVEGIMSWLSDENAKEDKTALDPEVVAKTLNGIRVERWKYKEGRGDGKHHIGPYAQEFAQAFGGDGLTIDPMTAVGIALAANQGNRRTIERLEAKVAALEGAKQ